MWRFVSAGDSKGNPLLTSLNKNVGRQYWEFDPNLGTPEQRAEVERLRAAFTETRHAQQHSSDELLRLQTAATRKSKLYEVPSQPLKEGEVLTANRVDSHLRAAIGLYESLQQDDGHFPGDYGGPMFLMPGLLITLYTTGALNTVLTPAHKQEMIRYLRNHQNEDGGFGLHIEGHSTMFGSALSYVALRILGVSQDDKAIVECRTWMHLRGGVVYIPSWGKFWLAVLGVYSWDGLNPMPPEMWLLPYSKWTGVGYFQPGRYWCHCRMVYLPMSYVYGARATCKETELTASLREELYAGPYDKVNWNAARNLCAQEDLYYPHPLIQDVLWTVLYHCEPLLKGSWLRKKALGECIKHITYEDVNTRYIDIGPVNKVINMLCCWLHEPEGEAFKRHLVRVPDYLWLAEDGMKMQGYNGSQLWDTAFAVQAIAEADMLDVSASCLKKAHAYIDNSQVIQESAEPLSEYYRHISKGAWPFSTRDHGWPISDCSSEGLKAALILSSLPPDKVGPALSADRLFDCVNVILSYQNRDGGMATYENTRSFHWLETLNPSETFGDIMVDYSYVECTSACITALCAFEKKYPTHRTQEIQAALGKAEKFIRSIQRKDGSWYGSWAVCFTYGCWFGVTALAARGYSAANDKALARCCEFLLSHQQQDGGWGESYLSSQDKVYSQLKTGSHVVNTGWAMLSLMVADWHLQPGADLSVLHRAAAFLARSQLGSGDWPQQTISGVFNRNCMITYANYRNIFPIWALAMYKRAVLKHQK